MVRDAGRRLYEVRAVLLVLVAALAGCGDTPTAPGTGTLTVTVDGVPPGYQPTITITGPQSYDLEVGLAGGLSSTTLRDVPAGTYTIVASAVTANGVRYEPDPLARVVVVTRDAIAAPEPFTYTIATARLAVSIVGLPQGVPAAVTLQGAGGFSRVITASEQLELLSPGTYILSPANVSSGGKTYRASQGNQPLILAPGTMATTTVVYGAGDGSLALTISGLPAGTAPAVTITGPDGIARIAANAPSPLQFLEPGSYTIDAGIVGSSLTTHRPVPVTQTVTIADGTTSLATVTYGSEPLQLSVQLVAEGLTQPVFLTAPDGDARLFIVERVGVVKIFANGGVLPTPFLDIRDRVNNAGERGLLSMAFDPQYATNGFFYVYYVDFAGNVVVERFASAAGSDVAGGSAGIVISIPHGGSEHHGGLVAFGPDGMMYLAPGDGGCCGDPLDRAQNGSTLLGKLLRIDVRTLPYQIPVDNPFTNGDGARAEIWASGLRSPWRFSFDLPTGTLHQADVGENDREEVNAVPSNAPGLNYGWRRMEGTACFIPATGCDPAGFLTHPVLEYTHAEGCSVIGGYVYRGVAIPELTGHYLYADFCRGWLRSFRSLAGAAPDQRSWNNVTLRFTNSFGRDGMGELYMIGGTRVWRIVRP